MRTLGLDMSTKKTGWAIFDNDKLEAYNLIEIEGTTIFNRTLFMYDKIQELISSYNVEQIVCEDVPVSGHSNLDTGKHLCVLQGCLLVIAHLHKIPIYFLHPTSWRAGIGINHSLYTCKTCGYEYEDISGLVFRKCPQCEEKRKDYLGKKQLNDRDNLKRRAVQMANDVFNLNLSYVGKSSKSNQDDIAEAILIGYSFLKGNDNNGR